MSGEEAYAGYEDWKGWHDLFVCPPDLAAYFEGEVRDVRIHDADVLEIGFGQGAFMAWACARGARVVGVELNPALALAAKTHGFAVLDTELSDAAHSAPGRFDTIVAIDVFEHLTITEIREHLRAAAVLLRPGGHLLLRFPNAQSPLGLVHQHGDVTHITALSGAMIEQMSHGLPLALVRYGDAHRAHVGGLVGRGLRRARYAARDLIAFTLNRIYGVSMPWDPVVTMVMARDDGAVARMTEP